MLVLSVCALCLPSEADEADQTLVQTHCQYSTTVRVSLEGLGSFFVLSHSLPSSGVVLYCVSYFQRRSGVCLYLRGAVGMISNACSLETPLGLSKQESATRPLHSWSMRGVQSRRPCSSSAAVCPLRDSMMSKIGWWTCFVQMLLNSLWSLSLRCAAYAWTPRMTGCGGSTGRAPTFSIVPVLSCMSFTSAALGFSVLFATSLGDFF